MYEGQITAWNNKGNHVDIVISVADGKLAAVIKGKKVKTVSLRLEDGRRITSDQRKKIYATLKDISNHTGYLPEEAKQAMKYVYIEKTAGEYFSLSDCSVDTAREFLNILTEFCLEYGVITSDMLTERTDDINTYLYQCIRYRKCAICGRAGEIHHWDAIGMGNNRHRYDDSGNRKICLCRMHHTIAHQKGIRDFQRDYHVYGIIYRDRQTERDNERREGK